MKHKQFQGCLLHLQENPKVMSDAEKQELETALKDVNKIMNNFEKVMSDPDKRELFIKGSENLLICAAIFKWLKKAKENDNV